MTLASPGSHAGVMTDLEQALEDGDSVLDTATALTYLSRGEIRWRVSSGRWQRPCRKALVAHSGPLTNIQMLRVSLIAAGPRSALGGLTAAWLDGFKGFGDADPFEERPINILIPATRTRRTELPFANIRLHYSTALTDLDVHPARDPRRTRMARSLVDAAAWRPTDRGAMAILAAGVQQGLTRVDDLRAVLRRPGPMRRRGLMLEVLGDIEGGAQALSELDFTRKVIRQFRLPEPSRQAGRRDSRNRQRWIDVMFDRWKVMVEIDGAQHIRPLDQWDDMERGNDFTIDGYRVLRFPAWCVRQNPEYVAGKILEALRRSGYRE